ncbi:MAG TPA: choice-of-anchor tandem repeat GloVer-containing protein [Candidatus Cybelea sp.]|jgi:uncharacterized repeat protein (TIGR03803 family)|nr:choice-of-anchor tandem repeat GloVer-containing protein [Candidatus Cybelea sp.]
MNCARVLVVTTIAAIVLAACSSGSLTPPSANPAARIAQHATGSSGYQQLYRFKGEPDGASPFDGLVALGGKLYGTTLNGSKNYCSGSCGSNGCYLGCGTVFSVTTAGKESVAYNFRGDYNDAQDGSWPFAPLILDGKEMYGVTSGVGKYNEGAFFKVNAAGKEQVVYSFAGGSDAGGPEAGLVPDGKSGFYGTSLYGGSSSCSGGCGTVFSVSTSGSEKVIYAFGGGTDGRAAYSGVVEYKHKLYGTTLFGGSGCGSDGCGTIYELTKSGKHKVLYTFTGSSDGAFPNGLTLVKGVFYGTAEAGGARSSGTIFSITPSGTEKTLYSFTDNPDGNGPGANLISYNGSLYGTTIGGGTDGQGSVFKATTSGNESVIYSFQAGSDGSDPQGPVMVYKGKLYGTTHSGGGTGCTNNAGCGTIFSLLP